MKTIKNICVNFLCSTILAIMGIAPIIAIPVMAEEGQIGGYTSVINDLEVDASFDKAKYKANANDYSMQVIQIAESNERELYLYVYQPSNSSKKLVATKVLLSTAINENFSPKLYTLKLLDREGVFNKYKVEGMEVKADVLRYYQIVRLQRAFDGEMDKPSGTDNGIEEVSEEVGQLWTACTVNGEVSYNYIYEETIEVTKKWTGFMRYSNGFKLYYDSCDAWFIAFDTDKRIDKLTEATVSYKYKTYTQSWNIYQGLNDKKYGVEQETTIKLSDIDKGSNEADGLFGKKYTWNRIESVETFVKNEEKLLKEETKIKLADKKWVLRFLETDYEHSLNSMNAYVDYGTEVSEETILHLSFETEGMAYSLGVIDNSQTPDGIPDGGDKPLQTYNWIKKVWEWIQAHPKEALVIAIAGIVVITLVPQLIPAILKGIVYVIISPILLVKWLIKKFKAG